ncbi:MAG: DUF6807 family protein [Chitinophagales bacterium]
MNFRKSTHIKAFFIFCSAALICTNLSGQHLSVSVSKEGVQIREDGKDVLFYQTRSKSMAGKYARAGYIHPLYGLNGEVLTEDFPEDHPYHHGIYWAWHQIIWGNKKIADGWISENISWDPVLKRIEESKNSISVRLSMIWHVQRKDKKPLSVVREDTRVTVYKSTGDYRVLDFDIRLFALVDHLKIGGSDDAKGYGGFCLRLKLPEDISFFSADSTVIPQETAVSAGPWMDFNGSFEGKAFPKSGVAVFCPPDEHLRSQQWILRREKSMQNVVYPGRKPVILTSKGLRLKYRIVIHNDKIGNRDLKKLYQQFVDHSEQGSSAAIK